MSEPFTDEDLKRLKERANEPTIGTPCCIVMATEINALFARLEAAETHCGFIESVWPTATHTISGKAWRKAAGRDL